MVALAVAPTALEISSGISHCRRTDVDHLLHVVSPFARESIVCRSFHLATVIVLLASKIQSGAVGYGGNAYDLDTSLGDRRAGDILDQ